MLIEFNAAYSAMRSYFDPLWEVINGSWVDWSTEISPKVRAIASARSRAALVKRFHAGTRLTSRRIDATVSVVLRQQMQVLVFSPKGFNGSIGIRLKKLDEDGLSRNQPTKQVRDFREQMVLPGIGANYHLEAGYVLDRYASGLASIDLVCPSGNGIYWKAEIVPNEGLNQTVSDMFAERTIENGEPRTVKVRRKSDKTGDEADAGGKS